MTTEHRPPSRAIALPTIHLNGTGARNLLAQYLAAAKALREASEALRAAAPHARDYYPQGDDAYWVARHEHDERVAAVSRVADDIDRLVQHTFHHT